MRMNQILMATLAIAAIAVLGAISPKESLAQGCGNQQRQVQQQVAAPILQLPSTTPVQTSQSVSLLPQAAQALVAAPLQQQSVCRQNVTEKQVTTIPQQQIASQALTLQSAPLIQQSSTAQALTSQCSSSGGGLLSKLSLKNRAKPSATTVTQITKVRQPRL